MRTEDIYTERDDIDVDTLGNLGPLRALAGRWEGQKGFDVNPFESGERRQVYVEHIDLQPTDPQSNGPQLLGCAITPGSSNRAKSRPITTRWAIGYGSRRPASYCTH